MDQKIVEAVSRWEIEKAYWKAISHVYSKWDRTLRKIGCTLFKDTSNE